jgi:predicted rRNA methylase YqxC with S4 and FtsJ domains
LTRVGSTPSPITGQKGNVEFLLHLRPSSADRTRT